MKNTHFIASLFIVILFTSCASAIKTKKITKGDLSSLTSSAYLPNTSFAKEFKGETDKTVEESLITVLSENMMMKGYKLDNKNPDLVVLINTSNTINGESAANPRDIDVTEGSSLSGPNYAATSSSNYKRYLDSSSKNSSDRPYKTGSLIIEIFNTKTKELVWIGEARDFTTHISDQTLNERILNEMFKSFPN